MTKIVEEFWPRVRGVLSSFSEELIAGDSTLACSVGHTSNDAYLLRAFLALSRNLDGDELSITVDIRDFGDELRIESDFTLGDGRIIAEGPNVAIRMSQEVSFALDVWLAELDVFLHDSQPKIANHLTQLK
jgi:hypothetical protein